MTNVLMHSPALILVNLQTDTDLVCAFPDTAKYWWLKVARVAVWSFMKVSAPECLPDTHSHIQDNICREINSPAITTEVRASSPKGEK